MEETFRILESPHGTVTITNPTRHCPKGHETPAVEVTVSIGDRTIARAPYCAVCLANYIGEKFPVSP